MRSVLTSKLHSVGETTLAVLMFAVCSTAMTVVNQLGVRKTKAPLALLFVQMMATVAMCVVLSGSRLFSQFGKGWSSWAGSVPVLFILSLSSCASSSRTRAPV
jgi:hypothetical protein